VRLLLTEKVVESRFSGFRTCDAIVRRGGLARLDGTGGPRRAGYGGGEEPAAIKFRS
jgi:hypothetical protein